MAAGNWQPATFFQSLTLAKRRGASGPRIYFRQGGPVVLWRE